MLPNMSVYLKVFSESKTTEEALFEFMSATKGIWVSENGTQLLNEM